MDSEEQLVLNFAAVAQEAAAMSDAALAGDLEEARFRARLLIAKADRARFVGVSLATADLLATLGPPGAPPDVGYGAQMLRVADELDAVPLPPGTRRQGR